MRLVRQSRQLLISGGVLEPTLERAKARPRCTRSVVRRRWRAAGQRNERHAACCPRRLRPQHAIDERTNMFKKILAVPCLLVLACHGVDDSATDGEDTYPDVPVPGQEGRIDGNVWADGVFNS